MAIEVSKLSLNCHDCDDYLKKENGCNGPSIRAWYINGEKHNRCPLKIVDHASWDLLAAYGLYKAGHLPHGKGWLNESEKFNTAMVVIEGTINKEKNKGKNG